MNHEYRERSRAYNRSLRAGDWPRATEELCAMAEIRRAEGCPEDEMKLLIMAFHLAIGGLSGRQTIDKATIAAAQANIRNGGVSEEAVGQLYLDAVRGDTLPTTEITPHDGLYLFTLCINGRMGEAQEALRRFAVPSTE